MLAGCQTHFGGRIDDLTLTQLCAFGYDRCRIDAQDCTAEDAALWCDDVQRAGMTPYVILNHPDQMALLPDGTNVELLNEPDLTEPDAREFTREIGDPRLFVLRRQPPGVSPTRDLQTSAQRYVMWAKAFDTAAQGKYPLWGPTVSNLNERGFSYLEATVPYLPPSFNVSVHRYSRGAFPYEAHPPAKSRDDEVKRLKAIIGDRAFCVSETGWHTCRMPKYGDWRKNFRMFDITLHDDQVAANLIVDLEFWERHGASSVDIFQLNDGPRNIPEHRFGLRTYPEGIWKPSAPRRL